jgi:MraZ protein
MARFFGRYEHSLDAKGRLILPSKFRHAFEQGGFLSQFNDRCLALWTPEDFEKQMAIMEDNQEKGRDERNLARLWAAGTQEVEIDKQGRMAVPSFLRDYARLQADVLVHGAMNRVELWDPTEWAQKVQPTEQEFTDETAS